MDPIDETILPKTNYNSPFYTAVPTLSQPTEVLSKRFELWRQIIKSLVNYFKATSVATNQFSIINNNIVDTISFPFFTSLSKTTHSGDVHEIREPLPENHKKQSFFAPFGSGSIQDLQILLKKYHLNMAQQQIKIVHELQSMIIPRLEELQKDLLSKIREIKQLNGDFKNNLKEDVAITGQCLDDYLTVVKALNHNDESVLHSKTDPFLLRIKLELHLKQQLNQENYLEEAFINLQMTGLELEKIVFKEVQDALNKYSELISQEIFVMYNDLINELHEGVISKKTFFEWDDFITRDDGKNFLKLTHDQEMPVPRKINTIQYPYSKHLISKAIRSGSLLKKSKILKNYTKSFFILTMNYLHEFKSPNLFENLTPVNSIKLNDCILTESTGNKFQLHVKSSHSLKGHNYVFKHIPEEMSENDFKKWIVDLKSLTSFNSFQERMSFLSRKMLKANNSGSGSGSGSKAATPRFEIPNPMDNIQDVTQKLKDIQAGVAPPDPAAASPYTHQNGSYSHLIPSTSSTPGTQEVNYNLTPVKSPKDIPISQPHENVIPRAASPVAQTIRSTSDRSTKQLSLDTSNVPTFQVQAPTPIQTKTGVPLLSVQPPSQAPAQHAHKVSFTEPDYFSRPVASSASSIHSGHDIMRATTPAIGDLNDQRVEHTHIDLGQPLYSTEEEPRSPVEDPQLEKVMDAIRRGSIAQ